MLSLLIYHLGFIFKINKPGWVLVPGGILLMILLHLFPEATTEEQKTKTVIEAMKSAGYHDRVQYWAKDVKYLIDQIFDENFHHDFYDLKLKGASHSNFYDVAFWSRFKALTGAGDIDPKKCFRITNRGILLFFDHYLKGKDRDEFHVNLNKLPGTQVKIRLK